MPISYGPRDRRRKGGGAFGRKNVYGIMLLVGAVILFASIGVGALYVRETRVRLDGASLCPTSGPVAVVAVVIDATDPITPLQQADIGRAFAQLRGEVAAGVAVELYTVGSVDQGPRPPVTVLCHPGRGSAVSRWTGNPELVEARWRSGFDGPLRDAFAQAQAAAPADRSPILASLRSVTITAFDRPPAAGHRHRLVIISDLLENSDCWSSSRERPEPDRLLGRGCWLEIRPDLEGVEVEAWYLRRSETARLQGGDHARFWERLIAESGGTLVRMRSY